MTQPTLWNQILIWPIMNVLVAFYRMFESLHVPWPLGWAVIMLTIAIRFLLYPLMQTQMKSAKKISSLKPHMDRLAEQHKGDKQALQKAQLALYQEHGVNPAAGCLPLLVQMPVLIALYNVFYQVLNAGNLATVVDNINQIVYLPVLRLQSLDLNFFSVSLALKPSEWQKNGVWLLAVPLITGLLQWYQTKLMIPPAAGATTPPPQTTGRKQLKSGVTDGKSAEKSQPDNAADMQRQMAMITPVMFGLFAFQFPLGLALYWNVFGLFGIMQQIKINAQAH
ncbi:hypothetical protein A2Z33_02995 [Candidatus Gottesmanbacteria bacterium RBG_16_52_11]|uniref:Membrane insertase YidC/Oxa/ALB C-terminal domain-containing protein n=1 Tax=Candidatus Gottesmanbacteria bacterium RBG_16_52_11 TaxID=1798374 RepID=A0A1F5YVH1_9BACT|nr:MAG: hypothetical protein A2Z33_02995 [Candidatus Gottesmanbacteria bacterium RBG_16_52_11]